MHREGHYGFTLVLASLFVLAFNFDLALLATGLMLFVTPLPDKDQYLPFVSHRGFTHTILFSVLVGVGSGMALALPLLFVHPGPLPLSAFGAEAVTPPMIGGFLALTITVALLGHIFADTLTVGSGAFGVKPYWPFSKKQVRFGLFTAANKYANMGMLLLGAACFGAAAYYKLIHLTGFTLPA